MRSLPLPSTVFRGIAKGLYKCEPECLPLEELILVNTKMSAVDLQYIVRPTRLGNLKVLNLEATDLRGLLEGLLGTGYPNLEKLNLRSVQLINDDVRPLTSAISKHLPKLKILILGNVSVDNVAAESHAGGNLEGCEQTLCLEYIDFCDTKIPADVFRQMIYEKRLPHLRELDVYNVNLKDHLGRILQRGFPSLRTLNLSDTKLTTDDVEHLRRLMVQDQLKLEDLDLSGITINNHLGRFLGILGYQGDPDQLLNDPDQLTDDTEHPGYRHLSRLTLEDTGLDIGGKCILTKAICCGKLPKLKYLYIGEDDPESRTVADEILDHFGRQFGIHIG